jgi:hypothetical protein
VNRIHRILRWLNAKSSPSSFHIGYAVDEGFLNFCRQIIRSSHHFFLFSELKARFQCWETRIDLQAKTTASYEKIYDY